MATIIDDGGVANTPATDPGDIPGAGRPERRACRRTRVYGDALIAFEFPDHRGITGRVEFVDASVGGLAVRSVEPAPVGSRFTLFPDKVRLSSWTGGVVRCVEEAGSYTLGLALARSAA